MYKIKLSPFSKPFYYEWKSNLHSEDRNLVLDMLIYGKIDIIRMKNAINNFFNDHVLANSHILFAKDELFWVKNNSVNKLQYSEMAFEEDELLDYIAKPFDLESGPLYRCLLSKQKEDKYRLLIVGHHIIIDGMGESRGLTNSIVNYYNDPNYKVRYSLKQQITLITQLNNKLSDLITQNLAKYQTFWQNNLADINPVNTRFLSTFSQDKEPSSRPHTEIIKELSFGFSHTQYKQLSKIARSFKLTHFMFGQMVLACLIYRYTGQNNFGISFPVAISEGVDLIYGSHINTIIAPYRFNASNPIVDIVNQMNNFVKSLKQVDINYKYCPINEVVKFHHKELLDIGFVQRQLLNAELKFKDTSGLEQFIYSRMDRSYKIFFEFEINNGLINYRVKFNKYLIDESLLTKFVEGYNKLFKQIADDLANGITHKKLEEYQLLSDEDYHKIVYDDGVGANLSIKPKLIHQLFEKRVIKSPNAVAILHGERKITYRELNICANQLAHYLVNSYNVRPGTMIALFLDASIETIIAILAVLKSGAAYVPISINPAPERVKHILNDTKTRIILTNQFYLGKIEDIVLSHESNSSDSDTKMVNLDKSALPKSRINLIVIDLIQNELKCLPEYNLDVAIDIDHLAYVIYTSGTTGYPKGVMVEHRNLAYFINGFKYRFFNNLSSLNTLSTTKYTFDIFGLEYMLPLLNGSTMHILDLLNDCFGITLDLYDVIQLTPSKLPLLLEHVELSSKIGFESRKIYLLLGGEAVTQATINYLRIMDQMFQSRPDLTLEVINVYGPTETTIWSTAGVLEYSSDRANYNINIGSPLPNQQVYVLGTNQDVLPLGAIGELYIGGAGVARGYLNQEQLTLEKFIPNPFQRKLSKASYRSDRLYKTGDLVRWLNNGCLEYIARIDSQVKIRGNRVELEGIEQKLISYPGIRLAKALAIDTSNSESKRLIAYYVSDDLIKKDKIINYLRNALPEYMIPSILIPLKKFPLTDNGKLDIKSLTNINMPHLELHVPPSNKLENDIVKIWSEVLNIPQNNISVTSNFFELGGDSTLIIKLHARLSKIDGFNHIEVPDLFKYTTVQHLVESAFNRNDDQIKIINNIDKEQIAIVAMSGAFSGANNVNEYWDLIQSGREGIKFFTAEESRALGVSENLIQHKDYIPASGHIQDIDKFDAGFWGISSQDANSLDPQIRKLLEHCWYLLESAGYINDIAKHNIGVFVGGGQSRYLNTNVAQEQDTLAAWEAANLNIASTLATRVSYLLGLTGPANNINTACSTSLVAIIEACKNIVSGYCDMAIAGGVSLLLPDETGYVFQEGMILSHDGHCRAFDNDASGTVAGSGVGVVLLKRLSDAKRDGDNIIAVIKGYATNNDGNRKVSYTAPSVLGQKECIVNAQLSAGITSDLIDYVECHGTGTKLGDPVEVKALYEAFKTNSKKSVKHKCIIGSVKANIGHTDTAAGIAGVIKVCKMFEHNIIPGQINYSTPSLLINIDKKNFEIITKAKAWKNENDKPRLVGVSSFGIGGTNAHIILSDFNNYSEITHGEIKIKHSDPRYILPISAKSAQSLELYKQDFIDYLEQTHDSIQNIAYTLQFKRAFFEYKYAIVCDSIKDAIVKFKALTLSDVTKSESTESKQDVIFLLPGQGVQYANMGIELYKNNSDFRKIVDECLIITSKEMELDFSKILFPDIFNLQNETYDINQTQYAQPALFIISYSLAILLENLGIKPSAYLGNSLGELVSATLAGVFSLEDAIKIVVARGGLMQEMQPGKMLAVELSQKNVEPFISSGKCEIAVITSPNSCVISGDNREIDSLKEILDISGITSVLLTVSHAYHSYLMDKAAKKLLTKFTDITLSKPKHKFISNVTGYFITDEDAVDPQYWSKHIRQTVQLSAGIETIISKYESAFFIEVGPGRSLLSVVKRNSNYKSQYKGIQLLNSFKEANLMNSTGVGCKEDILSKLWTCGYNVDFTGYLGYKQYQQKICQLPSYHFGSGSYWTKANSSEKRRDINSVEDIFYKREWQRLRKLTLNQSVKNINNSHILLFCNQNYILMASKFIQELNKYEIRYFLVVIGNDNYQIEANNTININIFDVNQINNLNKYLQANNFTPDVAWYFSSQSSDEMAKNDGIILHYVFNYILFKMDYSCNFTSISYNQYEVIGNEKLNKFPSISVGMTKSLPTEKVIYANHYDFLEEDQDIEFHLIELLNSNNSSGIYAIRNRYKWSPKYTKINLEILPEDKSAFNNDHVFLITGGAGGIGSTICEYLIENIKAATIIILGRRSEQQLGDGFLELIVRAQQNGIQIVYVQCDIASINANTILGQKLNKLNIAKIDVLFHAAGVVAKNVLKEKNLNEIKSIIGPKVNGTINLINLSKDIKINKLINLSSISSIIPSFGNMEYCAANTFLDEISYRTFSNINRVLTININQITDKGMAYNLIEKSKENNLFKINSMNSKELPFIINKLLCAKENNIIISKYDLEFEIEHIYQLHNDASKNLLNNCIIENNCGVLEQQIGKIFCEILGISKVSIYDSFFTLGATSIDTIKLITKLRTIGINLSLANAINVNSISKIYNMYTKNLSKGSVDELIVPLSINNKSNKNVFFIHAVGGSVIFYMDMIHELNKQYNYYGIQNINIFGKQLVNANTLEDLSEIYLSEILKIQSEGDYILVGSSMGGTIAYEIARRLINLNESVKFVAMFDSWATFADEFYNESSFKTMMQDQIQHDKSLQNNLKNYNIDDLIDLRWKLMQMLLHYKPRKTNILIHLYKAIELDSRHFKNGVHYDNGWQQYTSKPLKIYNIPGDHNSIHLTPGLNNIVTLLNDSLEKFNVD